MEALTVFCVAMLCVSAVTWTLISLFQCVDRRAEQWPLMWAMGLGLCCAIPVLGVVLLALPKSVTPDTLAVFSLHDPLTSLGLMPGADTQESSVSAPLNIALIFKCFLGLYVGGVCLYLIKLSIGRARIRKIILKADCADIAWQDDVLISPDIQSPFAWTPFGQVKHSRIVIPQSYRGAVSEAKLLGVLEHERAHISRRDDEAGLILRIILCFCWISPFAHSLFARWSQSTELRCDMAVTANRTPDMRKAYADTLLQALHIMAGRVQQYPAAAFSTHRIRNEKMRIKYIMDGTQPAYKRPRDRIWLGAMTLGLTAIGMLTISATATADPVGKTSNVVEVSTPMVSGRLTSKFGLALDPFQKGKSRNHYGIDIAAPTGTPIYAPADGVIQTATAIYDGKPAYGNVVVLETRGGIVTMFAHLDAYSVTSGQVVTKGMEIATVGSSGKSTGPHVHIETYTNGTRVDPAGVWDIQSE